MSSRGVGRTPVAALLLLASVAGCSGEPEQQAERPPAVEHPVVAPVKDRDLPPVVAALTRLDACALLDPVRAKAPRFTAADRPRADGPHSCSIGSAAAGRVEVALGVPYGPGLRYHDERLRLGRTLAYVSPEECVAHLPVSFEYSIDFVADDRDVPRDVRCAQAKAFATAAVAYLTKPPTTPVRRAMAWWDGCSLLTRATGGTAQATEFKLGARYSNDVDGCTSGDGKQLSISYAGDLDRRTYPKQRSVGGKLVAEIFNENGCLVAWNQARSGLPGEARWVRLYLGAPTCAEADVLAGRTMDAVDERVPNGVDPRRPVFYAGEEPDRAAPGACAELQGEIDNCQPYQRVEVSKGAATLAGRARTDPHVNCAIAAEAVAQLSADLRPVVTETRHCVFVESSHRTRLAVRISADRQLPPQGAQAVTVGEHSAQILATESRIENGRPRLKEVELLVDLPDRTQLQFTLILTPGRGALPDTQLDTAPEAQLKPLAAEIVTRYA